MSLQNKRIFIFQQRKWAINIGHFLAKRLQEKGAILGALTIKKQAHQFITSQKDVNYECVIFNDDIKDNPKKFLEGNDYNLTDICRDLGVDSIWPLVQSLRNHVKSFRDKYYYGFKQHASDEEIILYVKAIYKNILNIFEQFKPDIIIVPNYAALQHLMFNLYARKQGVKFVGVTQSRFHGLYTFMYDYLQSDGPLFDELQKLDLNQNPDLEAKARRYLADEREKLSKHKSRKLLVKKQKTVPELIKAELRPWIIFLKTLKTSLRKGTTINTDNQGIFALRNHYAHKKYLKYANQRKYDDLSQIERFIYFPMQFQPEMTIDVFAYRYNNQLEAIRQVALSCPDDYVLVVKDHPMMAGRRTPSYLEKVSRTPNVKLIDYRIPSEVVVEKCDLIVSPSGTTLVDAAFMNKPGIQLGQLGLNRYYPNVIVHEDISTLSSKIKEMAKKNLKTDEYEEDLLRRLANLIQVSFSVDYIAIWEKGQIDHRELLLDEFEKVISQQF